MKRIILAVAALCLATVAHAAGTVDNLYVGANGLWLGGVAPAFPSSFEAVGGASMSLEPHISVVGSAAVGLSKSYLRAEVGPQVSVTDVNNPNLSMSLGIRWCGGSVADFRPSEWAPCVSVGYRPFPVGKLSRLLVGGTAKVGLTSNVTSATAGLRWAIPVK